MKEALPKICSSSSSKYKDPCEYTACPYNLYHYDVRPDNWIVAHACKLDCMKRKLEG